MNINVARKLHERRFRASPVVTTGELLNLIGSEGMQEAMNNRWIVPEPDSGLLMLNFNGGKMLELESACRCACGKTDCACEATQEASQTYTMPMREAFAGFGLERPPTASMQATAPPVTPRPPTNAPTQSSDPHTNAPQIGDDAMVAEQDKTYTGKVASISQDGRIRLSFGSDKPTMNRDYDFGEVRMVDKARANA